MEYEINFLVLQSNTESLEKIREKVTKIITSHQGAVVDTLEYKKRKLAYEIKHEMYGFYTVFRFKIEDSSAIDSVKKDLNLANGVARYIIVRTDELPPLQRVIEPEKKEVPIKEKSTIRQEDVEKILAGKEDEKKKDEKKSDQPRQRQDEDVEKAPADEEKSKKPEDQDSKKDEPKKNKDGDSLEDLDKKLDEILNI